ncbi:MAG TPA: thioesterase domain-containing protein [Pyrinomonadaceae bacterium]|nr:thioesterase domain-containing protein [Pyrinomonadaceae bacterium]
MPEKSPTPWLPGYKDKPDARIRLFCFPYAGGNAGSFRAWQNLLPGFVQVSPVQPPGRGERLSEPAFKHLPDMIQVLGPSLLPFLNKPFAFFGHSMGALIVFEFTRWLRRTNNPLPIRLFISGRRAPQFPEEEPPSHDLPEPEFIERLRELNGTPHEVLDHPELMQLMIPLLRADFSVCENYQYKVEPPLTCPMTVFGGLGDVEVQREKLAPWREHTTSSFSLHIFPGDHFFIHSAQNEITRVIAQQLTMEGF